MNYQGLRKKQEKEFNELPIFWAFSNEQFERGLKKISAQSHDLIALGAGGYMKKADIPALESLLEKHKKETEQAMLDDAFALAAALYELDNHEFGFSRDLQAALDALGVEVKPDIIKKAVEIVTSRHREGL